LTDNLNDKKTGSESAVQINRIIPVSTVDGPGARTAVFVQGCNLACEFCHNPETQRLIDEENLENSGVRRMTADRVFDEIRPNIPFIRGITASGGECGLYPEFLTALFTIAGEAGLSTLMDSNGSIDLSIFTDLMEVTDGVMLDVKAWDPHVYKRLTGKEKNSALVNNLRYLAAKGKLEEIRLVCQEEWVDIEASLKGIVKTIPDEYPRIRLKLIAFRNHGVSGKMKNSRTPSADQMKAYEKSARSLGFEEIVLR